VACAEWLGKKTLFLTVARRKTHVFLVYFTVPHFMHLKTVDEKKISHRLSDHTCVYYLEQLLCSTNRHFLDS
jgi:hypothetical protein